MRQGQGVYPALVRKNSLRHLRHTLQGLYQALVNSLRHLRHPLQGHLYRKNCVPHPRQGLHPHPSLVRQNCLRLRRRRHPLKGHTAGLVTGDPVFRARIRPKPPGPRACHIPRPKPVGYFRVGVRVFQVGRVRQPRPGRDDRVVVSSKIKKINKLASGSGVWSHRVFQSWHRTTTHGHRYEQRRNHSLIRTRARHMAVRPVCPKTLEQWSDSAWKHQKN